MIVTIEAHELTTRTGLWCERCGTHSATSTDVALVAADSLRVLTHATGEHCASCDSLNVTR